MDFELCVSSRRSYNYSGVLLHDRGKACNAPDVVLVSYSFYSLFGKHAALRNSTCPLRVVLRESSSEVVRLVRDPYGYTLFPENVSDSVVTTFGDIWDQFRHDHSVLRGRGSF